MADGALEVFQKAEDSLRTGKFADALGGYLRVVRGVPDFYRARFRIADTLLNLKARAQALEVYKELAWHGIKSGQPLSALVAIKMATLLDPAQVESVQVLAEVYSRDSEKVRPVDALPRRILKPADRAGELGALADQALVAAAAEEAADVRGDANYPETLPAIPLFSFLSPDAFAPILASLQLRRYVKGQPIIQEGQMGDSFFMLAWGMVDVSRMGPGNKAIPLARLSPGAVFGEMALVSRAPRTATVSCADEDCDLLELKRAALEEQAHKLQSVTQALRKFTHDRFLTNLTATSPVFKPLPRSIRTDIVKKFKEYPVEPGDEIISEGEAGEGLFLILRGSVEVTKTGSDGQKVSLAKLKEGDVFGEISLLQDTPTTATVAAVGRGDLLFLPKKDFNSTMAHHPELKAELMKVTAERIQKTKDILDPGELVMIEDDDLILL